MTVAMIDLRVREGSQQEGGDFGGQEGELVEEQRSITINRVIELKSATMKLHLPRATNSSNCQSENILVLLNLAIKSCKKNVCQFELFLLLCTWLLVFWEHTLTRRGMAAKEVRLDVMLTLPIDIYLGLFVSKVLTACLMTCLVRSL